ncbi:N-terminal fungal transcription regulatory domain-containing protein [Trichoderma sp. SZMC 28013]
MQNYASITHRSTQDTADSESTSPGTLESKRRRVGVSIAATPVCPACKNTPSDCVYRDDSGISEEFQSLLLEVICLNAFAEEKVLDKNFEAATMSDAFQSPELGSQYPNAYPRLMHTSRRGSGTEFMQSITQHETILTQLDINSLINVIITNDAQDPDSGSLALRFCTEAESLGERQHSYGSVLNLTAVQLLSLGYLGYGRDHVVLAYLNEATYASRGSFNWITHMSLFYHPPGLQCPKVPLKLRISWDLEPDVTGKPESLHNLQVEPDLQQTGESNHLPPTPSQNNRSPYFVRVLLYASCYCSECIPDTALTYLANAVLQYPKDENWFFYFLLCAYDNERLRPCWYVTRAISTALLSMASREEAITSPTARQSLHDINGNNSSC